MPINHPLIPLLTPPVSIGEEDLSLFTPGRDAFLPFEVDDSHIKSEMLRRRVSHGSDASSRPVFHGPGLSGGSGSREWRDDYDEDDGGDDQSGRHSSLRFSRPTKKARTNAKRARTSGTNKDHIQNARILPRHLTGVSSIPRPSVPRARPLYSRLESHPDMRRSSKFHTLKIDSNEYTFDLITDPFAERGRDKVRTLSFSSSPSSRLTADVFRTIISRLPWTPSSPDGRTVQLKQGIRPRFLVKIRRTRTRQSNKP